jgi:hypothetical protein
VTATRKVESLHKALLREEFKETEDGGAANAEATSRSIV